MQLFAVSPQTVENNRELAEKLRLKFEILHDHENAFANKLDLAHGFPDDLKEVYLNLGADLGAVNGESSWTLPIPTRVIVDADQKILSITYDADYKKRPEPEEVLSAF
jgi:peroxiredoxin